MHRSESVSLFRVSRLVASMAAIALIVSGCTVAPKNGSNVDVLSDVGLAGQSVEQMINALDAVPLQDRSETFVASVQPDALLVINTASGEKVSLPIDGGEQYVSVAPFVTFTHDCYFHSLTTCVGEMQNVKLQVKVTDTESDDVVFDGDLTTFDNGFFGLWLPKNSAFNIEITDGALSTSGVIETHSDSATCVTTLQLT